MKRVRDLTKRLFGGYAVSKVTTPKPTTARKVIGCPLLNSMGRCNYSGLPCQEKEISDCYYYTRYNIQRGGKE